MKIKVKPNGNILYVYTDDINWKLFGKAKITKTADVEFENGQWVVTLKDGTYLASFDKRQDAINYEVKYIEENIL